MSLLLLARIILHVCKVKVVPKITYKHKYERHIATVHSHLKHHMVKIILLIYIALVSNMELSRVMNMTGMILHLLYTTKLLYQLKVAYISPRIRPWVMKLAPFLEPSSVSLDHT